MYAQVLDHSQRDAEASDTLATPGGAELKIIQGPLDKQDSCSAPASLCAVKAVWKNVATASGIQGLDEPLGLSVADHSAR